MYHHLGYIISPVPWFSLIAWAKYYSEQLNWTLINYKTKQRNMGVYISLSSVYFQLHLTWFGPLRTKLLLAFLKEANTMKPTISAIHLDLVQDYIFIWATADYCPQRGVLKLDYPLVGDAFDPMDEACRLHTLTSVSVFPPTCLGQRMGQQFEMTPIPLILRLPWLVIHICKEKMKLQSNKCFWQEYIACLHQAA